MMAGMRVAIPDVSREAEHDGSICCHARRVLRGRVARRRRACGCGNVSPVHDAIKRDAIKQLTSDPAVALVTEDDPLGAPMSFRRIEAYRNCEQPWMHETFRFEGCGGALVLEIGVGQGPITCSSLAPEPT
jgi:hypothetical protein